MQFEGPILYVYEVLTACPFFVSCQKEAELHLPKLSLKEGGLITIEDADRNQWQLRYR